MNVDDIKAAIEFGEREVLPRAKVQGGVYYRIIKGRLECLCYWQSLGIGMAHGDAVSAARDWIRCVS